MKDTLGYKSGRAFIGSSNISRQALKDGLICLFVKTSSGMGRSRRLPTAGQLSIRAMRGVSR